MLTGSFAYCWKSKKISKNILTNMVSANQLSQRNTKKSMDILLIRYKQTDNLFKALLSGDTFGHLPGGSAKIFDKA